MTVHFGTGTGTSTGTEVGNTVVTAAALTAIFRSRTSSVAVVKPAHCVVAPGARRRRRGKAARG
jgi:dethiobiotin synthetase